MADRRLWLALGVVTGIGLENKDTLLLLGASLALGLILARRWDVMRSPWAWAAIAIAPGHLGAQPRLAGDAWLPAIRDGGPHRRERR